MAYPPAASSGCRWQCSGTFQGFKVCGTRYHRDSAIIRHFKYDTLRKFYHDWYRDLQCIAIVGDINVDEVEKSIKAQFTSIPAVENPLPRGEDLVPLHKETRFYAGQSERITDSVSIYINIRRQNRAKDMAYYRDLYVIQLFNTMMGNRYWQNCFKKGCLLYQWLGQFWRLVRGYNVMSSPPGRNLTREMWP